MSSDKTARDLYQLAAPSIETALLNGMSTNRAVYASPDLAQLALELVVGFAATISGGIAFEVLRSKFRRGERFSRDDIRRYQDLLEHSAIVVDLTHEARARTQVTAIVTRHVPRDQVTAVADKVFSILNDITATWNDDDTG